MYFIPCTLYPESNTTYPTLCVQQQSYMRSAAGGQADSEEARSEARLRLLAGLKRYFHGKRAEGLLSGTVRESTHHCP